MSGILNCRPLIIKTADRSLLYLCRAFDDLKKGVKYTDLKPTIHIGILDFSPFPEEKEFYSEYQLMNIKTHRFYNSKFLNFPSRYFQIKLEQMKLEK